MNQDMHQKVKTTHLKRNAYLYIRQSTLRQVFENSESTKRQYALRQKAVALGWPEDRIIRPGQRSWKAFNGCRY
jgi:DNA invertase Pin-like site-specific DNA recombinase